MTQQDRTSIYFGMIDHSAELTGTQLYVDPVAVDGGNWDTLITDAGTSVKDILVTSIATMTKLNFTNVTVSMIVDQAAGSIPSAADAQREWALQFIYVDTDNSNKRYRFSVPAPLDAVVPSGTDVVNLANVIVAAFITVIETYCVSPDGGAIEVIEGRLIGRNS